MFQTLLLAADALEDEIAQDAQYRGRADHQPVIQLAKD
jgi:hypothetical protein